ncbi:histone deacetylase family protein [Spirochaetota bacterium]
MKIIFHEKYYNSNYAHDPAAAAGRLDSIMQVIEANSEDYEVIIPEGAAREDILRAHSERHYMNIKDDTLLFEMSALAAGGSILAAEEGYNGNPAFAVIRPPGHHASSDSCWGFCYFNNMSVSLLKLFSEGKIKSAFVLDFDLHTGDGNINILESRDDGLRVDILNPISNDREGYIKEVEDHMKFLDGIDIFAASAGFDQGINDWGNLLNCEDYLKIGELMRDYSNEKCMGRRYALLEGGYYHDDLGKNVDAFCQGFK